MLLVVHGFASHSEALAFEWAWQHPLRSRHARDAVAALAGGGKRGAGTTAASGARGRVRALFAMLNAPAWRDMPLTVTLLSSAHEQLVAAALPADEAARGLPRGMRLETAPVETLVVGRVSVPAAGEEELLERDPESNSEEEEEEEEGEGRHESLCCCSVCSLPIEPGEEFIPCAASASAAAAAPSSSSASCRARSHPECLADSFLARDASGGGVVPTTGQCPACGAEASWLDCLGRMETMKLFSSPSRSRSSPAKRREAKAATAAAAAAATAAAEEESSPEKKKKKSSPQRRRRRARVAPKASPEELEAFAVAARENAPLPAPPAALHTSAATAAAPRAGARVSPSKRPRERPPSNGEEEPILIVSSSSSEGEAEEGEGRGRGGGGERAAPAPAAAVASSSSSLLLSPLATRLAALSTPSSSFSAGGKLRGGARPGEWPPRIGQQQQQQQQIGQQQPHHHQQQ